MNINDKLIFIKSKNPIFQKFFKKKNITKIKYNSYLINLMIKSNTSKTISRSSEAHDAPNPVSNILPEIYEVGSHIDRKYERNFGCTRQQGPCYCVYASSFYELFTRNNVTISRR